MQQLFFHDFFVCKFWGANFLFRLSLLVVNTYCEYDCLHDHVCLSCSFEVLLVRFVAEMLLTTVFLALATVGGVRCSWRDGDNGVDRRGGDLPNMPISSVGSPGDCSDACDKNSGCVAWAFGTSGCGGSNSTACWLKNALMPQSLDSCRVSC